MPLDLFSLLDIQRVLGHRTRVMVTSRTHYFRSQEEQFSATRQILETMGSEETGLEAYPQEVPTLSVRSFSRVKATKYAKQRLGQEYAEFSSTLLSVRDVPDLITRPILADFVCREWRAFATTKVVSVGTVYDTITRAWIARDSWRSLSVDEALSFFDSLALDMYVAKKFRLHHSELGTHVKTHFGWDSLRPSKQRTLLSNIRTCTFLNRDRDGNYEFMHRSFLEYFAGRGLAKALLEGADIRLRFWEAPHTDLTTIFMGSLLTGSQLLSMMRSCQPPDSPDRLDKATSLLMAYVDLGHFQDDSRLQGMAFSTRALGILNRSNTRYDRVSWLHE